MSHTRTAPRRPRSRLLAALLAAALTISGAAFGAAPAYAAGGAVLTVTEAPRDGGPVTIQGAGFNPDPSANGVYVGIRQAGASADTILAWVAVGNAVGTMPGLGATAPMNPDGSFSVELPAPAFADGVEYVVHTRQAHGGRDETQKTSIPLVYAAAEPEPATQTSTTVTVSPAGTSSEGQAISIVAAVSPAAAGTFRFLDGEIPLAFGVDAVDGAATLSFENATIGSHSFRAEFTPTDAAAFTGSVSNTVAHTVTEATGPVRPTPTVTVSKSINIDPAGETVTVTGSGFLPNAPDTSGTRPPLAGKFTGAYVVFGSFAENWKPSAGAPSSARKVIEQKWGVHEADLATIGGAARGGIVIAEDGTFSTTLTVSEAEALENGRWGIYTYGGGGAKYAPFETFTPVLFKTPSPIPAPTLTVTPNANLDPSVENVLTVNGSGYIGDGAVNGAYVLFGEKSVWDGSGPLVSAGWITQGWVPASQIVDGAFTTTVTIPAGTLSSEGEYNVATSAAHALSITNRTLDAFAPVTVAAAVTPEKPTLALSAPTVVQGGEFTITGAGFPALGNVALVLHSDPVELGATVASAGGAFRFTGKIPATVPAGEHTIVATSGSVTASFPVTITAAPAPEKPAAPVCLARAVDGASFEWGVKASFVSYVQGGIAKGAVSGGWGSGSGAYSTETGNGRVSFGGSMHFTGHSGALDLTLSNPRVRVTGSSAQLILDVSSKGFNGSPDVNASGVNFATLSLSDASTSGSSISWTNAPATLTSAGAEAFAGFYAAGDALDPVSIRFPLGAEVPCDSSTDGLATTGAEPDFAGLGIGALLLVAGLALTVIRRRRLIES